MHFEYKWGQTLSQYWDAEETYGPKRHILMKVVALKYQIETEAHRRWPTYASHEEDLAL